MMKTRDETINLTVSMSRQARLKLEELKMDIRKDGVSFGETRPGKILERLILSPEALESLKKAYRIG